jgi:5-methylthioadenosine/S-adenosylhomocysteine deaminase
MPCDILIHNGIILTLNDRFDILYNGFIAIQDGRIVQTGEKLPGKPFMDSLQMVDASGGIIIPGLINTHAHLPMTLFRGLADDIPLSNWLNDHIFPAEAAHLNPDSVKIGTLLACAEMLLSGTTTCCDGYFFEDAVAEAVLESGMRAILAQGVIDFPAPGVPDPKDNVDAAERFIQQWADQSSRIMPSIFCHSPYTCSSETLLRAKALARKFNVLFQIHAAETQSEFDLSISTHGKSPIAWLDSLGLLDSRTLLVHCIWIDPADIDLISRSGARISHAPESAMKLASGVAPIPAFLNAAIPVGLGTDGCASNNDLDMFNEMGQTARLHKIHAMNPTEMNSRTVLRMATIEAANALGLSHAIGSIEPGKQADIVILDAFQPHLLPLYHPESQLVHCARGADVRDVMIAGQWIVKNRRLLTFDPESAMQSVKSLSLTIQQKGQMP